MSNGATAEICEFRVCHCGHEGVVGIYGTEGSFEKGGPWSEWTGEWGGYDFNAEKVVNQVRDTKHHEWLPEPLRSNLGGHGGSHTYLVHEFVDSVNKQRLPLIKLWEAVRYCAPRFVAHKSALLEGRVLKIPDWGDAPE